jgi:hypothetical protein
MLKGTNDGKYYGKKHTGRIAYRELAQISLIWPQKGTESTKIKFQAS